MAVRRRSLRLKPLYAEQNYFGEVGIHGVGPHWTSKMTETSGSGIFSRVTFIQRTNTTGGLAPTQPGMLNELKEVPYTAEYYFYRAEGPVGR